MRQILLLLSAVLLTFTSCEKYEDYLYDYEYTATYFALQKPVRTITQANNMALQVGVTIGGVRENNQEHIVNFEIDETLLEVTPFTLLPEAYYSLSDANKMVIPKGEFLGLIDVDLNEEAFMADEQAHLNHYALPLRITETTADSTLGNAENPMAGKDYTILVVKYINNMHGYYYQKGNEYITDATGAAIDTIEYSHEELVRNETRMVATGSKDSVVINGVGSHLDGTVIDKVTYTYKMALLRDATGNISIKNVIESDINNVEDLGSSFDLSKRLFTLHYKWIDADGLTHTVEEELIFRNDGILFEEWSLE
ncbi:DUF1735 domain-containing protein [Carboxylicivirga mesophila]|uniref:DUF1735 domain-containing protein n=1 Tax=Carboxylicivirga mesophila TaxID=1166478 RepID=A0ABS5K5S4_9BACT|nr:DUF1735 domain-containing protein [Carboxylicivirga mesophila]MBS2210291.1 DUF1735 domain-containing protein [Carboxylicivirga mesophila]